MTMVIYFYLPYPHKFFKRFDLWQNRFLLSKWVLSLLLIKALLGNGCSQPQGHLERCMIPFWISLLMRINHIWVLSVLLQFDKNNCCVKYSESPATPGGYL